MRLRQRTKGTTIPLRARGEKNTKYGPEKMLTLKIQSDNANTVAHVCFEILSVTRCEASPLDFS